MTSPSDSHSEHFGANRVDPTQPNWNWLRQQVKETGLVELDGWLDSRLLELEESFQNLITPHSLSRYTRQQLARERR